MHRLFNKQRFHPELPSLDYIRSGTATCRAGRKKVIRIKNMIAGSAFCLTPNTDYFSGCSFKDAILNGSLQAELQCFHYHTSQLPYLNLDLLDHRSILPYCIFRCNINNIHGYGEFMHASKVIQNQDSFSEQLIKVHGSLAKKNSTMIPLSRFIFNATAIT